jgi:hypothetical protein
MVWNRELSQIKKNKTEVSLNSKLTFSINVEHFSTQSSTFELMLKIIIIIVFNIQNKIKSIGTQYFVDFKTCLQIKFIYDLVSL